MEFIIALLLVIATTQAMPIHRHCNTDAYLPASGMVDLKKNSTMKYCLIDTCTIMRIDTGKQLDIVYTTQSLLIVTPTDGQTSMIIRKNEPELFCPTTNTDEDSTESIAAVIVSTLVALVSGYIAAIHFVFKELRTNFGKLMIFYNVIIVLRNVVSISLYLRNTFYPTLPCYPFIFSFIQSEIATESFSTCILGYLAYIMHHSLKSRQVTKQLNKQLYKHCLKYVLGSLLLFDIFIISYDFGTGASKNTLLPNGRCSFNFHSGYDTIAVVAFNNVLNKVLQLIFLVIYFVCQYKLNKMLKIVRTLAVNQDRRLSTLLCKIAVTMGATVRASHFVFIFSVYAISIPNAFAVGGVCLLLQQCTILTLMMTSRKMSRLCKERCSKEESA